MSLGSELRAARERAGLTPAEISLRTKIQLYKVEALENDHFESLPDGIYLRGIVRAYAKEVGIDAEPIIARLDQELAAVDVTNVPTRAASAAPAVPVPAVPVPAVLDDLGALAGFESEEQSAPDLSTLRPAMSAPRVSTVQAAPTVKAVTHNPAPNSAAVELYPPVGSEPESTFTHRPRAAAQDGWSLHAVGVFLLFVAVFGLGVYVAQRIRAFHNASAATAVQTEGPHTRGQAARRSESDEFTSNRNMAAGTSARTVAGPSPSLAGSWRVATHVESANYAPFSGLNLGYEIQLKQTGDRISGAGQKVSENARTVRSRARTPISVNGTVEGDRVQLRFTEHGARRASGGTFDLVLAPDGKLHGRFAGTAANSSGTVDAKRID